MVSLEVKGRRLDPLRWTWRPPDIMGLTAMAVLLLAAVMPKTSLALKNELLSISTLCPRHQQSFLSSIPNSIDGAVLESHNERDVECVTTFATESILKRFMVRFERLQIDCNDMLYIYDGAHAIGAHKANLSCEKTIHTFGTDGVLFTRTNFLTLKYRTDSWGTDAHGFKLIITAFKDAEKSGCRRGFQCDSGICIDNQLVCDNVDHCGDGADERHSQFCSPVGFPNWMNGADPLVSVTISAALGIIVVGMAIAYLINKWRRKDDARNEALNGGAIGLHPVRGSGGFMMRSSAATRMEPIGAENRFQGPGRGGPVLAGTGGGATLMATGNTHHLFDSAQIEVEDPFAQSSSALTNMIVNQGNANHPAEEQQRGYNNNSSSSKMATNRRTNNNNILARTMLSS